MEKKVEFQVEGMNCNSCVEKIKEGLDVEANVSLEHKTVSLVFDSDETSPMFLKKQIEGLGFKVSKMSL